jgi:hypothetical protein
MIWFPLYVARVLVLLLIVTVNLKTNSTYANVVLLLSLMGNTGNFKYTGLQRSSKFLHINERILKIGPYIAKLWLSEIAYRYLIVLNGER